MFVTRAESRKSRSVVIEFEFQLEIRSSNSSGCQGIDTLLQRKKGLLTKLNVSHTLALGCLTTT